MISSLRGRLAAKNEDYVIVEVGGEGFKYEPLWLKNAEILGVVVHLARKKIEER